MACPLLYYDARGTKGTLKVSMKGKETRLKIKIFNLQVLSCAKT